MRRRLLAFAVLMGGLKAHAEQSPQAATNRCSLEISIVDDELKSRPYKVTEFSPRARREQNLAARFKGTKIENITCGEYFVHAEPLDTARRGAGVYAYEDAPIDRHVTVGRPGDRLVVVQNGRRELYDIGDVSPRVGLTIRLLNVPSPLEKIWAQIQPVAQSDTRAEAMRPDVSGMLMLSTRAPGMYVLSIWRESELMGIAVIHVADFRYHTFVTVDIGNLPKYQIFEQPKRMLNSKKKP